MISGEDKDQGLGGSWKPYSRSISFTEIPPRTSTSKSQSNSKARACLPPLQPLSISRSAIDEWPKASSDDLGVWTNPPTPGARPGSVTPRESSISGFNSGGFEFRRDKLAFFNKECSRILDHIYLGSDDIAKSREILMENGITHVLNCVGYACPEYFKDELVYKTLWLKDSPSEDITSILYDVFDYFEDVREQGGRVFVHCFQGISRSNSLVIAYVMWKEGQNFYDAFQYVKAARGVTNPNLGFASQLLQCQNRVHALPPSPNSALRMYQMAPHSSYDPLHLVPKMMSEPCADKLDSRGAFIIQIPSALYIWIGQHCDLVMSDTAWAAATQVVRYERVAGPIVKIREGDEPFEFWDVLSFKKNTTDGFQAENEANILNQGSNNMQTSSFSLSQRTVAEYDKDFEIFYGALAGGFVPAFPLSESVSETCLPARENGWNRLRRKIASGGVKELITSQEHNGAEFIYPDYLSIPTSTLHDDSLVSSVTGSWSWNRSDAIEVGNSEASLSTSPSFSLVDDSVFRKANSSSTSPSVLSSASDSSISSSSFTFSLLSPYDLTEQSPI